MLRRRFAYPTFWLSMTGLLYGSRFLIDDKGVGAWAVTFAILFPAMALASYLWFRRTGDLPGEGWSRRRRERQHDRWIVGRMGRYRGPRR